MSAEKDRAHFVLGFAIDTFFDQEADAIIVKSLQYTETEGFADKLAELRGRKEELHQKAAKMTTEQCRELHANLIQMKDSIHNIIVMSSLGITGPDYKKDLKERFKQFTDAFGLEIDLPNLGDTHPVTIPLIRALSQWMSNFYPGQCID